MSKIEVQVVELQFGGKVLGGLYRVLDPKKIPVAVSDDQVWDALKLEMLKGRAGNVYRWDIRRGSRGIAGVVIYDGNELKQDRIVELEV